MASLDKAAAFFRRLGNRVDEGTHKVVRQMAIAVDRKLVLRTPVDTGRARSNWLVGINSRVSGTTAPATQGAALSAARARITASKPGDSIFISNNLPYIGRLNAGASRQAPPNYVEDAAEEAAAEVGGSSSVRIL